jgi:hypothetical protein
MEGVGTSTTGTIEPQRIEDERHQVSQPSRQHA